MFYITERQEMRTGRGRRTSTIVPYQQQMRLSGDELAAFGMQWWRTEQA
jgi:hypothetical protein